MLRRVILAVLLCAPICFGLETIIEPKERMTKNLMFVLDRSCSMEGPALTKAVRAVVDIAGQSTDDINVACIAFGDEAIRWNGLPKTEPDGGPPPGWAAMPSQKAVEALSAWLANFPAHGGTNFASAFQTAMAASEPRKGGLTVVMVSDDVIPNYPSGYASWTEDLQKKRADRKLSKAILVAYRIGKGQDRTGDSPMTAIVKAGPCGGFFQEAE